MEAANSSIHKYFVDDLSDLIDCMDFGFHQSLIRVLKVKSSAVEQVFKISNNSLFYCDLQLLGSKIRATWDRCYEPSPILFGFQV